MLDQAGHVQGGARMKNPFRRKPKVQVKEKHQTDLLIHPKHGEIKVDRRITKLVWAMWAMGIETYYSCEGNLDRRTRRGAAHKAAYVLMKQDDDAMWYVQKILSEYPHFVDMTGSFWEISFDRYKGVNRVCIRFPHDQISGLTDFTGRLASESISAGSNH